VLIGLEDGLLVSYNSAMLRLNFEAHLLEAELAARASVQLFGLHHELEL
jgi:hypothetical protein